MFNQLNSETRTRTRLRMQNTAQPSQAAFALKSDDDGGDHKMFPWRHVMGAMKRLCPELKLIEKADRRDAVMRQFYRRRGATVGCFELLCRKVQASDYLMARNGHKGKDGRPFPWSFIFEKNRRGVLRADELMDGETYSNANMAFLLEPPKPKPLSWVMLSGAHQPGHVNLDETLNGKPRYAQMANHMNGLPQYMDRKP